MIVTYSPSGQEARAWDFDFRRVPMSKATAIERLWASDHADLPGSYLGWVAGIRQDSAAAIRILLWHLLTSDGLAVTLKDIDPLYGEVDVELDSADYQMMADNMRAAASKLPAGAEREELLHQAASVEAVARQCELDQPTPKAGS